MTSDATGRPATVLVAGSINTDLVVRVPRAPEAGETVTGDRFDVFGGGKGANQALACVRSGVPTAMLGAVGNYDFGRQRLADLEADGITCAGVAIVDGYPSGVALITLEESGQNRIAYIPGAARAVSGQHAATFFAEVQPAVVLTTLEPPPPVVEALIEAAGLAGVRLILNATPEPAQGRDLALKADVLVVNQSEARELLAADEAGSDWIEIAGQLRSLGPRAVVVTLGADGALLVDDAGPVRVPAPAVQPVDTTDRKSVV